MIVVDAAPSLRPTGARAIPPACTPVWPPGAQAIDGLVRTGCRWPIGKVSQEGFRFCNAPRLRGSYCGTHHGLSRQGGGL